MFRVLSDIHLDSGSVRIIPITQNTTKQDPFGIYIGFGFIFIGSDSVRIIGFVLGYLKTYHGIWQDEPISPYISILCSKIFYGLCKESQFSGSMT
ncbi:hypothetical protein IGI04_018660 [Brassica rapa subsp. trilocularis]|uniref:Uncharacterized protein n=1 Tax=Brassica rapa subsp. trilocularis TaxID=1813537 RepID=A0ABQ7MH36_BRACM|nr:hypothetical protein IGI04_018660 [Brassica rapa subsp. trilocularis]